MMFASVIILDSHTMALCVLLMRARHHSTGSKYANTARAVLEPRRYLRAEQGVSRGTCNMQAGGGPKARTS